MTNPHDEQEIDYKDKWFRAVADYQNLQKEMAARQSEWILWSEWQILSEFVRVYDHLKKAFHNRQQTTAAKAEQADKAQQNWVNGIEHIMKQFEDVLKTHGVEEIETIGKHFDPALHEVLGEEESEREAGTILREIESGYKKGEKVLKVAKVVVAK